MKIGNTKALKISISRGAWVAQLVKHPSSPQVRISRFVSSSPALGSVLTAQGLEPASDSGSPSLSDSSCSHSVSLSKINKDWECKLVQPLWKTVWRFLKKLKIDLPYDPTIAPLCIYPKGTIIQIQRGTCTPTIIAALSTIAKVWIEPKCPSY